MPTYEYKCDACGHTFERFQSITAAPVKRCPECGKAKVRRLISTGGGMIFKGSGFYITDYRDKSYTDEAKAESGISSDSSKSDASKSDAPKSDATTETKSETRNEKTPAPKTESKLAQKESKKEPKPKKSE